ncbi:hypothetical protein ACP70R_025662 [Stipagrostis hirtigluma subsp. patula]
MDPRLAAGATYGSCDRQTKGPRAAKSVEGTSCCGELNNCTEFRGPDVTDVDFNSSDEMPCGVYFSLIAAGRIQNPPDVLNVMPESPTRLMTPTDHKSLVITDPLLMGGVSFDENILMDKRVHKTFNSRSSVLKNWRMWSNPLNREDNSENELFGCEIFQQDNASKDDSLRPDYNSCYPGSL